MVGVQEGVGGGNPSKRWRNISERSGKIFLQEMEKYFWNRCRNISTGDGEISVIDCLNRETCKLS